MVRAALGPVGNQPAGIDELKGSGRMTTPDQQDSDVYDIELSADVLVIGGGPAGAWAALAAADEDASVVVVEKGYTGTSGPFGVGAATGLSYPRPDDPEQRDEIVQSREPIAYGLSDPA